MLAEMSWLDNVCLFILIVAAFAWGVYGFFMVDLFSYLPHDLLRKLAYALIVLAGFDALFFWRKCLACSHP